MVRDGVGQLLEKEQIPFFSLDLLPPALNV